MFRICRKLPFSLTFVWQEYTGKRHSPKGAEITEDPSDHAVDLLFLSEKCLVSEAASGLMKTVHDTLKVSKKCACCRMRHLCKISPYRHVQI